MKKQCKTTVIFAASIVTLLGLIIWTIWGNTALEVNEYRISSDRIPETFSGFRIAQVSDLHNTEFGEANHDLIAMLSKTDPDIIVITGDLIDSRHTDIEIALEFCRSAVEIAPAYYVTGNHEARVSEYKELKAGMIDAGVTVLENQKVQLGRGGERVSLIGIDDPSFFNGSDELSSLVDPDCFTILLSHRPERFDDYVESQVDLVFSGHAHGGQFRLPFVGGLVAPNQGFFPQYDAGTFSKDHTTMVVSRGLGNSIIPIRFNNRPELVVVVLE